MRITRLVGAMTTALVATLMLGTTAFAWAPWVNGTPPQLEGGEQGYFMWHDDDGWHLRTHDGADGEVYDGRLHTDGELVNVEMVRGESTDLLEVTDAGHTLRFRFRTYDHVDGINFRIEGGSRLTSYLERNGHWIAPRNIYVGGAGAHPAGNPFSVWR
ncbi:MAG: hypothetical protein U0821_21210 [Chloroflexota bacterium]